jgi:hypothetical protein
VPIRVPLTPQQIAGAGVVAEARHKKYGSPFMFNLTGALGEIAAGIWLAGQARAAIMLNT